MNMHLVNGTGSSSQQVLHYFHVVVLTGLHQWCPLVLITHVQVRSSLNTSRDKRNSKRGKMTGLKKKKKATLGYIQYFN